MASTTRTVRAYDHRFRDLVQSTGNIGHATRRGVPRSTARGWLTAARAKVVTLDAVDGDMLNLQQEVLALRKRVAWLVALLRLVVVTVKISGFSFAHVRIPDAASKVLLLHAINRSRSILPLRAVLRLLRLSQSRYHSWKREDECGLDDIMSCPRSSPQQLTRTEVEMIKEMVSSEEYRHIPTGTLALLAQRLGKVFSSLAPSRTAVQMATGSFTHPSSQADGRHSKLPSQRDLACRHDADSASRTPSRIMRHDKCLYSTERHLGIFAQGIKDVLGWMNTIFGMDNPLQRCKKLT